MFKSKLAPNKELLRLFDAKLREALAAADLQTIDRIRATWLKVEPSPSCVPMSSLMREIKDLCHTGLMERKAIAKNVAVEVLLPFRSLLTPAVVDDLHEIVRNKFPSDLYVEVVKHTWGVYSRKQAPSHKACEKSYKLDLALCKVMSANISRESVVSVRVALDELLLLNVVSKPPRFQQLFGIVWREIAKPTIGWLFVLFATLIGIFVTRLIQ